MSRRTRDNPALHLLLGRPLAWNEQGSRKLGVLSGIPALGLDALSSSAYGPEAALAILIPVGAIGVAYILPISLVILALLGLLYLSYRQTIAAYPTGGGSYTVAKENLGTNVGLLAAAALLIDYVLNVAVGISAGVGALVSAIPSLHQYTLALCLTFLAIITVANLRGTREAGLLFAFPAYLLVASLGGVLLWGTISTFLHHGHPSPVVPPPNPGPAIEGLTLWLLLRAFASGCTAMTGVEAVSNGITAFREPAVAHARKTLSAIIAILALLLAGIAYLARTYGIAAMDQSQHGYQSVLSQLTAAVAGRGAIYYLTITSLLCVLSLSANTSFVDFPRLSRLVAQDGFLPDAFATLGRRLVYSTGILFLAAAAGGLLIAFDGITQRLIPLFAVGAFTAFTCSQTGMVMHWRRLARHKNERHHLSMALNGLGAVATAVALAIIIAAKFMEGAWVVIVAVPLLLTLFKAVRRQYARLARELAARKPLHVVTEPPVVLLPIQKLNRLAEKSIGFGMQLSPEVVGVHLSSLDGEPARKAEQTLQHDWAKMVEAPAREAGVPPPKLVIIHSKYRRFTEPLLEQVRRVEHEHPGRRVAVIIPELVKRTWWEYLLHKHRSWRLRSALMRDVDPRLVVITVPWHIEPAGSNGR